MVTVIGADSARTRRLRITGAPVWIPESRDPVRMKPPLGCAMDFGSCGRSGGSLSGDAMDSSRRLAVSPGRVARQGDPSTASAGQRRSFDRRFHTRWIHRTRRSCRWLQDGSCRAAGWITGGSALRGIGVGGRRESRPGGLLYHPGGSHARATLRRPRPGNDGRLIGDSTRDGSTEPGGRAAGCKTALAGPRAGSPEGRRSGGSGSGDAVDPSVEA